MTKTNLAYTAPVLRVDNQNGRPWLVRYVRPGDRYGLDMCLVHGEPRRGYSEASLQKPMLMFHDYTKPEIERDIVGDEDAPGWEDAPMLGYFVSSYYVDTLRDRTPGLGLCLQGSVPAWNVDAILIDRVMEWAEKLEMLPKDEQPLYSEELDAYGQ
jgi:hypothetical protein